MKQIQLIAFVCILLLVTACQKKENSPPIAESHISAYPSPEEVRTISEEAFVYGLPIAMNYAVMSEYVLNKNSGQYKAPFNTIHNEHRVFTYKDTTIVTPNSDTPYSMAWLDLRSEPVVISVPAVPSDRYYSVQLVDGNTYNYGYIGSRTTGVAAGSYMISGPGWTGHAPAEVKKVLQSSTPFSLAIFRTQLFNPKDMKNVEQIQSGYKVQTLSEYLRQPNATKPPEIDFPIATTSGIKDHFFEYLDAAIQFVPAAPGEGEIRSKLLKIGVGTNKPYEFKDLPALQKIAALEGMKAADEKINNFLKNDIKNINGWGIGAIFGNQAFYNGNWLIRAAAVKAGIYGNNADEAVYPNARITLSGEALDTSKKNYALTFPPGQLPPVNAFWSVTMYDGKSQFLIKNPINRYLINSPMMPGLKKNKDGSLTIYLQKKSPGIDKESNWLPAPNGKAYVVMRLYWPKTEAPSILPAGSGTWSPPGIVEVQ